MTPKVIVSYDDTANDQDALALGRVFARAGATVSLAYVRHTELSEHKREAREEQDAAELLERGAQWIGIPDAPRHVVVHASTGEGLWELAEREGADVVVFGSDYRTAPGAVQPGTSAQWLLNGGPVAVAIAPANLRSRHSVEVARIGVLAESDEASEETARTLAAALGGTVVAADDGPVDLLVAASRPEAQQGHVSLSATAQYAIETADCPALVVPRGAPVRFAEQALASA
jgi:nucleotide-binding universal stress UspA family protein